MQRGKDSGRVDDNEETIANRIKIFHELSEPVIQEYASIVLTISGEQEPDDVFNQCCENLDPLFKTWTTYRSRCAGWIKNMNT